MGAPPDQPKIYHITHWDNVPSILKSGVLWSDKKRIELGLESELVGMSAVKERRLKLPVKCFSDSTVGEYVPFYLCPRSVMLYILHMGNHPEVSYSGGQIPIVHLESDMRAVVAWAESQGRRWAFTDCNAATGYASFFASLESLDKVDWAAVEATDFRDARVRDGKQAEFLVHESFPWELVERIGVLNARAEIRVSALLAGVERPPPPITIAPAWYY